MSDRARMVTVLIAHQRQTIGACLCGWAELGRSHAEHVADAVQADRDAALAALERVRALRAEWLADLDGSSGKVIYDQTARTCWHMAADELRAALDDPGE